MQVTETLSDGLKRAFAVVVPAADIETRRASRLSELAKQVNLPGFRPGKVPMPIVRQRFGGAVAAEVLEQTINETTQQLLSERDLRPAVMPKLEMVTQEPTGAWSGEGPGIQARAGTAAGNSDAGLFRVSA